MDELDFPIESVDEDVFRLIYPPVNHREILVRRGISPGSLDDTVAALNSANEVRSAINEAVFASFSPRSGIQPLRFGDGVLYTALEDATSIEEIKYHLREAIMEDGRTRDRWMVCCHFSGRAANLVGLEGSYPELISQDRSGYSFCQGVATKALRDGLDGMHSRSARKADGTCVPIFSPESVTVKAFQYVVVFVKAAGDVRVERQGN